MALGLPAEEIKCMSCMIPKSVNKKTLSSDQRTFERMDTWNVDLVWPFETPAMGGGLYILTMRDISLGYAERKILANKWEATKWLTNAITQLDTLTNCKLKILGSNNGGEFNNNVLAAFLCNQGITTEQSVAYHHYQNGCIKQYKCTLQDMVRTLLIHSGLPKPFGALAFIWACYTLNRIPNLASGNITPCEKMFLQPPNLDCLRSFGSKAFAHIPVEKRTKLEKQVVMVYVVYYLPNSKGWGFWIQESQSYVGWVVAIFLEYPCTIQPLDSFSFDDVCTLQLGSFEEKLAAKSQNLMVDEVCFFLPDVCKATTPSTYKQAIHSAGKAQWELAMEEELCNLDRLGVCEIQPVPAGKISCAPSGFLSRRQILVMHPPGSRHGTWQKVLRRYQGNILAPLLHPLQPSCPSGFCLHWQNCTSGLYIPLILWQCI
jgi:hypothetical protein